MSLLPRLLARLAFLEWPGVLLILRLDERSTGSSASRRSWLLRSWFLSEEFSICNACNLSRVSFCMASICLLVSSSIFRSSIFFGPSAGGLGFGSLLNILTIDLKIPLFFFFVDFEEIFESSDIASSPALLVVSPVPYPATTAAPPTPPPTATTSGPMSARDALREVLRELFRDLFDVLEAFRRGGGGGGGESPSGGGMSSLGLGLSGLGASKSLDPFLEAACTRGVGTNVLLGLRSNTITLASDSPRPL
mmetsp:Transcript_3791/g.7017  ORF Transcript_3791/g.7017 Transcript_3791/m.7017 type:complete len:250 (+) Transcript_3791:579-1328(+)